MPGATPAMRLHGRRRAGYASASRIFISSTSDSSPMCARCSARKSFSTRSFAELRDARSLIASALAAQAASTAPIRHQLASFSDD